MERLVETALAGRRQEPRKTSRLFVVAGLAVIFGCGWYVGYKLATRAAPTGSRGAASRTGRAVALRAGDVLPDIQVERIVGPQLQGGEALKDYIRGPTLIFAFTTTCPFCARSVPYVQQLEQRLRGMGVDVLAVALDVIGSRESSVYAWDQWKTCCPVVAPSGVEEAQAMGVSVVPTCVLVDEDFSVRYVWQGEVTPERVRDVIRVAGDVFGAADE